MADKLSRRKIAIYVADRSGKANTLADAIEHVAGYLVEARRTREVVLVVRAIEDELAARGQVVASVTTARPLDAALKSAVEKLVEAKTLYIRETVDPSVIGGVRIDTPGATLDATIKHKLLAIRQAKI
jgi:F-type H+-transporting ATPase subunit delta